VPREHLKKIFKCAEEVLGKKNIQVYQGSTWKKKHLCAKGALEKKNKVCVLREHLKKKTFVCQGST